MSRYDYIVRIGLVLMIIGASLGIIINLRANREKAERSAQEAHSTWVSDMVMLEIKYECSQRSERADLRQEILGSIGDVDIDELPRPLRVFLRYLEQEQF
jgi:hypothetical protein